MTNAAETTTETKVASTGDSTWTIRALTRRRQSDGSLYVREARVETQLRELMQSGERERSRRLSASAAASAWDDPRRLREETLVACLRACLRCGDEATAWQIAETLIDRTALHVKRGISRWRLTPEEGDDCARDLYAEMCAALFDCDEAGEFWEVRFWVCLDRRLQNAIERRQKVADNEAGPGGDAEENADGDEGGGRIERALSRLTDPTSDPATQSEYAEALALLTETERSAVYLVYIEGLPEESDDPERLSAARLLGVTGRSIRNYLRRAKEKLARYQQAANAV